MDIQWSKLVAAVALPNVGGWLGAALCQLKPNEDQWYKQLVKPKYNPPNWVFGPAWTALYSSMGYASYLVWQKGGGFQGDAKVALSLYGAQLALNFAWTPLFFGLHKIDLALVDITCLLPLIAVTAELFRRTDPLAGALLLPYLLWTSFAALLNFQIAKLNRAKKE